MGYYVTLTHANFVIPPENLDAAYKAMCDLNVTHDSQKTGGAWSGGKQTAKWFAWMDANYPETCEDAAEIFKELGFDYYLWDDGSLEIQGYDRKIGNENLFIEAAGRFANEGWFLHWRGEEGEQWVQTAEGTEYLISVPASLFRRAIFTDEEDAAAAKALL